MKFKIGNHILNPFTVEPPSEMLTIDLNNIGLDLTADFLSQTKYPGVWEGFKVFETNDSIPAGATYHNFIKNISNLSSNFTIYYWFGAHYNSTTYEYGQANYTSDGSILIPKGAGWTHPGEDYKLPQYDKSRYRTVTVDVSKGGDIDLLFHYTYDGWYGSRIYYALDENLVSKVINSR